MDTLFVKTRTIKDYIISISLLAFGVVATFLGQDGLAITGVICIITGFIMLFVLKTGLKNKETGDLFKSRIVYFNAARKAEILDRLEKNNPSLIQVDENELSHSLKLDIMYCHKSATAKCQLSEYVPYKYRECSEIYSYNISQVENLLK